jgi:bisanhydrobacterioruberin hydratase
MLATTIRSTPPALLLFCALFFGASYFTVRFPDVPGAEIGSYVSTFLIALPALVALFGSAGWGRGLRVLVAVSVFAYVIEGIGVATGFPYGRFYYGDALGPRLLDLVPYLLPVTYVPLVLGAVAAAPGRRTGPRIALATLLLVLVDAVLDPGAASLGFWVWPDGGAYYGIPLSNYFGWLLSGAGASALVLLVGRVEAAPPGMVDSLLVAAAFWTGVAVFSGLVVPAVLGVLLVVYLLRRRARLAAGKPTSEVGRV